jgi:TRAP-type C4-dicarboxylate transport system permease large subunit
MSGWKGSKKFVLSTSNSLGGQNYFLGVAFIVVGCLCVTLAMIFFAIFMSKKNSSAQQKMRQAQVARQESLE